MVPPETVPLPKTLRPVTVLQCARATQREENGNWFVDGAELGRVSFAPYSIQPPHCTS